MGDKNWLCSSWTSENEGLEPFWTDMKKECEICGFSDTIRIHHIIPLKQGGDHCEENVVILCPNHHALIHNSKFRDKLKLSKPGKKIKLSKEEVEYSKKREEAIQEAQEIIYNNLFAPTMTKEEKKERIRRLFELFEIYNFDYYDCICRLVGITKPHLLNHYIFNTKNI